MNKCKGCQWHNKTYWSIINPCDNCPNEDIEKTVSIKMPLFEEKELEIFDNNIHSIIEEYSKLHLKEKDQILTQRIIIKQEEEIDHLKSIIKEVREYIKNNQDNRKGLSVTDYHKWLELYDYYESGSIMQDILEILGDDNNVKD